MQVQRDLADVGSCRLLAIPFIGCSINVFIPKVISLSFKTYTMEGTLKGS